MEKARHEFAGKMHDDLIDAVDWAIQRGIADPRRVAIHGVSSGGYATLVGLTFTPEKFACGVDIVGFSNVLSLIESFPPYWQPVLEPTWYRAWAGASSRSVTIWRARHCRSRRAPRRFPG